MKIFLLNISSSKIIPDKNFPNYVWYVYIYLCTQDVYNTCTVVSTYTGVQLVI